MPVSCCELELTEGTVAVGAPTLDDADDEQRGDGGGRGIIRDVEDDIQASTRIAPVLSQIRIRPAAGSFVGKAYHS